MFVVRTDTHQQPVNVLITELYQTITKRSYAHGAVDHSINTSANLAVVDGAIVQIRFTRPTPVSHHRPSAAT